MALPSSGELSLKDILDEKQGSTTARTNVSLEGLSKNSVADSSGGDITINANSTSKPDQAEPHSVSEFHGYDQTFSAFSWSTSNVYAPAAFFTQTKTNSSSGTAVCGTSILVTWNQNNTHTVQFQDFINSAPGSGGTYSTAQSFTSSTAPSQLEVRWLFYNYNRTVSNGADSGDKVEINYHSANSTVFTGQSASSATGQTYTGPWQSCKPYAFSGNNANAQTSYVRITTSGGGSSNVSDDIISIFTTGAPTSGQFIGLQYRANQDNNKIITFRQNLATNVSLTADSYFDGGGSTCIMPDMLVIKKVTYEDHAGYDFHEYTRIGDIQVGDYILAQGDLNDPNVMPQWAEVTEARTHNREGYWDVGGIHITNDHPVWLTDDTHSAWVTVDSMRDGISRSYVEGSVDPVYLGTTPGHYYVYSEDQSKVLTVSGDYAPQTD
jgi:hypothetical protein